jgi:hypothetical protein
VVNGEEKTASIGILMGRRAQIQQFAAQDATTHFDCAKHRK